jgi:hypothetical protein
MNRHRQDRSARTTLRLAASASASLQERLEILQP